MSGLRSTQVPERVLLLGAGGKTGESYARLLQSHGHHVLWYDKNAQAKPTGLEENLLTHIPHDRLAFSELKDAFTLLTLTPAASTPDAGTFRQR